MSEKSEKKPWNWLWIAGAVSAAYFAGVVMWGLYGDPGGYVDAKKLNSFGDFLAGIFAPLALIWLVAAVFTQRQELNESRKQFHDSQDVIRKQMESIERQNGMLVLQHNLAQETAKRTYRLSLFERRFKIYEELRIFGETSVNKYYSRNDFLEFDVIRSKAAFVFSRDIEGWLIEVGKSISEYADIYEDYKRDNGKYDKYGNFDINKDEEIEVELKNIDNWLWQQFSGDNLREKLWSSMRVSDD